MGDLISKKSKGSGALEVGYVLQGRYEIREELGSGGFAVVYSAFDSTIERQVAIKVLNLKLLKRGEEETEQIRRRFLREAKLAARINHPSIVEIYDYGLLDDQNRPYIIMEFLEGDDLEKILEEEGAMDPRRLIPLYCDALHALDAAHQAGIIHKDLKPANLFFAERGGRRERLKVVDFGIAHIDAPGEDRITTTGTMTGTPQYMPPEYLEEQEVSPRIDIYQMGLILVEALCGVAVVEDSTPYQVAIAHMRREFRVPEAILESPLGEIFEKSTASDPDERYARAEEFARCLESVDDEAWVELGRALGSLEAPAKEKNDADAEAKKERGRREPTLVDKPDVKASPSPKAKNARKTESVYEKNATFREAKGARVTAPVPAERGRPSQRKRRTEALSGTGQRKGAATTSAPTDWTSRLVIAVVAVALTLGAGVIGLAFFQLSSDDDVEPPSAVAQEQPSAIDESPVQDESVMAVDEVLEADPEPEDPSPEEDTEDGDFRVVTLISEPSRAEVWTSDGTSLGLTPQQLDVEEGDELTVELTHSDTLAQRVTIDDSSGDIVEVVLESEPAPIADPGPVTRPDDSRTSTTEEGQAEEEEEEEDEEEEEEDEVEMQLAD